MKSLNLMTLGLISGVGFAYIGDGNLGNAAWKGFVAGAAGAVTGAAIGGAYGAAAGGAVGGVTGAALNGQNILTQGLLGGATSFALYHFYTYYNYIKIMNDPNMKGLTYNQFDKMSTAFQRSIVHKKEYGGFVMKDGSFISVPEKDRRNFAVTYKSDKFRPLDDALFIFHTHWAKEGMTVIINSDYNFATNQEINKYNPNVNVFKVDKGVSLTDFATSKTLGIDGILFDNQYIYKFDGEIPVQLSRNNTLRYLPYAYTIY